MYNNNNQFNDFYGQGMEGMPYESAQRYAPGPMNPGTPEMDPAGLPSINYLPPINLSNSLLSDQDRRMLIENLKRKRILEEAG